jgi:hypothetical protein
VNLADAAEAVLEDADGDGLTSKEIAEAAEARGLISPRSETPWVYVAAAMRKDNRRREQSGEQPRFRPIGGGRFGLNKGS